jgi:hypothetical protein
MHHNNLARTIAILASLFAATHCESIVAQTYGNQNTALVGVWDLKGTDTANTKFIATMVLTNGKAGILKGHIDWLGSNGSCGREHVTGSYDAKSKVLKIIGIRIEFSDRIIRGTYRAELSQDGSVLEKGKWSATGGVPGQWSARRINLR